MDLITVTDHGLYCPQGDFHIDPWRPVARAVITHAHSDHARPGHAAVLCSREGEAVTRLRTGLASTLETLAWGERRRIGQAVVSLHPAGHILGSAQVRVEAGGQTWVVSGDYKVEPDPTCTPFEPVPAHVFVTESTFGLPVWRWPPQRAVMAEIAEWWHANQRARRSSVLYAYALGKAQRLLAGLAGVEGPILVHGALEALTDAYRAAGVALPATRRVADQPAGFPWHDALVLAPPSAQGSPWLRRFGDHSDGFASGWMLVRGHRRRRAVDRGFVLSDHADWPGLLSAIAASGASRVLVTHGQVAPLVRWLVAQGLDAGALDTRYGGEADDDLPPPAAEAGASPVADTTSAAGAATGAG